MRTAWRDHGLSLTLGALFLIAWTLQTWTGWVEYVAAQAAQGAQASAFGPDGYLWSWAQATFENWQSEFLQVFVFIVLTTFLVHRGSHESPDADYATEAALRRIEAKVDALASGTSPGGDAATAADTVEHEHVAAIDRRAHWLYLLGVLGFGTALMLALMFVLSGT